MPKVIPKTKPHVKSAPLNNTPAKKKKTPKEKKTSTQNLIQSNMFEKYTQTKRKKKPTMKRLCQKKESNHSYVNFKAQNNTLV